MKCLRRLLPMVFLMASAALHAEAPPVPAFDYYTLAISLTPAFCDQNPKWRDSVQCRDRLPFTVHGLWPEWAGRRTPYACAGGELRLSDAQQKNLRGVMPDGGLRRHEWEKHGRCSGLDSGAYFDLLSKRFQALKWPPLLTPQGRDAIIERDAVLDAFQRSNPGWPRRGIVLRCEGRDRPPLLSEIRLCLARDGRPTECEGNFRPSCPVAVKIRAR